MSTELNGIKISALPAQPELTGNEMVPFASGGTNGRFTLKQIFDRINDAVKSLAQSSDVTALRNSLNSLQSRLDTLVNGNSTAVIDTFTEIESFLAGVTNKETLTGLLAELKTQVQSYADDGLANKVDKVDGKGLSANDFSDEFKDYIDATRGQMTIPGYYSAQANSSGQLLGTDTSDPNANYWNSGLIPLDRLNDIVVSKAQVDENYFVISFFDNAQNFISGIKGRKNIREYKALKEEFPSNAIYFAVSSWIIKSTQPQSIWATYSNGSSIEATISNTTNAIAEASTAMLAKRWVSAWQGTIAYGSYVATDSKPFKANELEFSADEALLILEHGATVNNGNDFTSYYASYKYRTALPPKFYNGGNSIKADIMYGYSPQLEVVRLTLQPTLSTGIQSAVRMFQSCPKLRKIIDVLDVNKAIGAYSLDSIFGGCVSLEFVQVKSLKTNISFSDSPLLSLESLQYLVANAANTTAITVTVHADVYAKLTDTANAEWFKVLTDAVAKNISFATV